MKRILLYSLLILCIAGVWYACKKADDEPLYAPASISRLYISFSDIANSDTQVHQNVVVIDPADSADYIPPSTGANTKPQLGMGVFYSPDLKQGFQVSRDDTSVRYFSVNNVGNISTTTRSFKDTIYLHLPRAIRYDNKSDQLFITNDSDTSSLNIYYNPARLVGQQAPTKRLQLANAPWGMATGMMVNNTDSILLLSMQGGTKQIWGLKLKAISSGERFESNRTPDYRITIEGAGDLRGIAYSPRLDILVLSDIGTGNINPPTPDNSTDGKIYIIENAKQVIAAGGTVTPTRIITGLTANLVDPIDVAITDLPNRNHFIYVVDRAKRLSRFAIDASGDAKPDTVRNLLLTPEFMYLDSRGPLE